MNAADIIADRLVTRGIYLERYKAGLNNRILGELEKLEDELTRELASSFARGIPNQSARIRRLEGLLGQTRHVIKRAYAEKASLSGKELLRLAANEQTYVVDAINETAGIEIADRTLNYDELKALTDDTLIEGAKSADWWERQSEDLQNRFTDQMRSGVLRGETLDQLVARLRGTQAKLYTDGVMQASRRQADALVRTSVQTIANETRGKFYAANSDVVSAEQWVATLDSRTTHICMALNQKLWTTKTHAPIGHDKVWPGRTAHWCCRSTQVPVLKKWEDLVAGQDKDAVNEEYAKQLKKQGFTDDEVKKIMADSRYSLDGKAAADTTFDDWLSSKSPEMQDKMLGPGKAKLFRDKKITLTDLVDQSGRPLTIDELESLPQPRPGPKPIKLPTPRKKSTKPPAPVRGPNEFPPIDEIEDVRTLGGSTGAKLVRDTKTGKLFVRKSGASPDHIREEHAADQAYQAAGISVPRGVLYETPAGPVKLAEFIEGETLDVFLAKASSADAEAVMAKMRKGFVADATLANHDVVGLSFDNVLVDMKGTPWRIDNGGSLRFRAQGAPKSSAVWNGNVAELETMRDASVNPQTARIFAAIDEAEIEDQIRDLMTRESAIIDTVPDAAKPILRDRFATLKARLDHLINEDVVKRVKAAKVQGISLPGDRDEFEDVQFLLWEEIDLDGNPLTAAKLKLTTNGAEKVMEQIRDSIPKKAKAPAGPKPLPEDTFWQRIEPALKTINHHVGDGQYNVAKLEALRVAKAELAAMPVPTKALQDMKAHYEAVIQSAETAITSKTKTPIFQQFTVTPPTKTPKVPTTTPKFNVREETLTWNVKTHRDGVATRTANVLKVKGDKLTQDGYVIELGGVKVRFIPYRDVKSMGSLGSQNAQALMGQLEVEFAGAATRQNLNRAIDALKQLGLSPTKASPDYLEAVWLRKTLAMRVDVVDNALRGRMREIMELPGIPDSDRVAQLRDIAKNVLGIDPPRDPAFWMPRPTALGRGWGTTERWDLTVADIERHLSKHSVHHRVATPMPDLISSLLSQGAELTSTAERVRKGIDIVSGMSPDADLVRGGANHVYTRIQPTKLSYGNPGLVFKRSVLARQDAFSFGSDWYGGVDNFFRTEQIYSARAKTVDDLLKAAKNGGNETLFKWGLSLLDDLDVIVVGSAKERAEVLKRFRQAGISTLADGRKVDSIVRLASDPIQ